MEFNLLWYYLMLFFVPMYVYYCYKKISLIFLEKIGITNSETKRISGDKNYYLKMLVGTFFTLFLNPFTLLAELHKDRIMITDYNNSFKDKKKNIYILFQMVYLLLLFSPLIKNIYILFFLSLIYSFSFLGFFMVALEKTLRMVYFHFWSWILFLAFMFFIYLH